MIESSENIGTHIPIALEDQVIELREWAEPQHDESAEYHPFPHAWNVYETSMWLADCYEAQGVNVDRRPLAFASVGHDTLVHVPLEETVIPGLTFASKEHRSAWLLFTYLSDRGYDISSVAQPAHDLVVATKNGEPCNSVEAQILRMADIFNTQDPELFEDRARAFYAETCRLENKSCSFEQWLPGAMSYLEGFLDPNLPEWFVQTAQTHIANLRNKYALA